jgi:hypothetical protein
MNAQVSGKTLILSWDAVELPVDTDTDAFDMDNTIYNDNGIVPINV